MSRSRALAYVAIVTGMLCSCGAPRIPGNAATFAEATVERVGPGPRLGALVEVRLADVDEPRAPRVLLDAAGRAGFDGTDGPVTLPFSSPVREVLVHRKDLCCARTVENGLECLFVHGDLEAHLRKPHRSSEGVRRLRFPTLTGRVTRLRAGHAAPCFAETDGTYHCAPLSTSGFGPTERFFLGAPIAVGAVQEEVATRPVGVGRVGAPNTPGTTCWLTRERQVRCRGPGVYGERGDGDTSQAVRETTVVQLQDAVELAAGDRWVCARTAAGELWCWGALPRRFPVTERGAFFRHPACTFDRAASEALRAERVARDARDVQACMQRTCAPSQRDCHLGCAPSFVPHELVFDRRQPCEVPVIADGGASRWPTDEEMEAAYTEVDLAVRPTRLAIPRIVSVAGRRDELCVVDAAGVLHCWRA